MVEGRHQYVCVCVRLCMAHISNYPTLSVGLLCKHGFLQDLLHLHTTAYCLSAQANPAACTLCKALYMYM
jgi:hypothetical protein